MPKKQKTKKSKKVVDLKKTSPTVKRAKETEGFSVGLGMFFIFVIAILGGLLLFNLIVHFIVRTDVAQDVVMMNHYKNGDTKTKGSSSDSATRISPSFKVSFDLGEDGSIVTFTDEDDNETLYLTDGVPVVTASGVATFVASIEIQDGESADVAEELTGEDDTVDEITFGDSEATEITDDATGDRTIVFDHDDAVYVVVIPENEESKDLAKTFEESFVTVE